MENEDDYTDGSGEDPPRKPSNSGNLPISNAGPISTPVLPSDQSKARINADGSETEAQKIGRAVKRFANVGVVVSACVAVATIAQAITAYYQLNAMQRQSDLMKSQFELMQVDQQPFIRVNMVDLKTMSTDQGIQIAYLVENAGKSPCRGTIRGTAALVDSEMQFFSIANSVINSQSQIMENAPFAPGVLYDLKLDSLAVNDAEIKKIESGEKFLITAIHIQYTNKSGEVTKATFFFRYGPKAKLFSMDSRYCSVEY